MAELAGRVLGVGEHRLEDVVVRGGRLHPPTMPEVGGWGIFSAAATACGLDAEVARLGDVPAARTEPASELRRGELHTARGNRQLGEALDVVNGILTDLPRSGLLGAPHA